MPKVSPTTTNFYKYLVMEGLTRPMNTVLAVQNSSIGDLVTHSLTVTFETFEQSDEDT